MAKPIPATVLSSSALPTTTALTSPLAAEGAAGSPLPWLPPEDPPLVPSVLLLLLWLELADPSELAEELAVLSEDAWLLALEPSELADES